MSEKLWGGRFSETTERSVEAFTASVDVDWRLYTHDIEGSIAHCRMLARQSIITDEEASRMIEGLGKIKREIDRGKFHFDDDLEDVHMNIESGLLGEVGKIAQKLHTARSRNDQVVLDTRMFLRDGAREVIRLLVDFRKVFTRLARRYIDIVMPGYTHLQRAQPVLLSHHLMAYQEMFSRDEERFRGCMERIDVMPLGCAALAGTPHPIDREYTAKLLGFPRVSKNSIDSVSDRDFILEFMAAANICMIHLSRLSEELIIWAASEFNFIELPDAFSTGSSIMPQKKNPDVCELVRGKTSRVLGDLVAMLSLMKAQPLAYNRDMQEDKEPLFHTVDTLTSSLDIYIKMLPALKINREVMEKAAAIGCLNATDLADYLVDLGMPFRKAHGCVGKAVQYAIGQGKELHDLTLKELKSFSTLIKKDVFDLLTTRSMIDRRLSFGGTATKNVVAAIEAVEKELAEPAEEQTE